MNSLCKEDADAWKALVSRTHTEQAIWWLNGFWNELEGEADEFWNMVHIIIEIECGREKRYGRLKWEEKEGCDLDQFQSHRFLEKMGATLTVKELRAKVKNLDVDSNKRLALSEYLADKYSKTIQEIANAPQGGQAAQDALDAAAKKVHDATELLNQTTEKAEIAKVQLDEAKKARESSDQTKKQLEEVLKDVEREEKIRDDKIQKLKDKISDDKRYSAMKLNTFRNELAQIEGEDPLPLRKAKLTSKAMVKKSKKALKKCNKEEKKCEELNAELESLKDKAAIALEEAQEALTSLKENGDGIAHGQVWWMERELNERKKYMPRK